MIGTVANEPFPDLFTNHFFPLLGGHHQAKAGQRPQEDPGAQGQISC